MLKVLEELLGKESAGTTRRSWACYGNICLTPNSRDSPST